MELNIAPRPAPRLAFRVGKTIAYLLMLLVSLVLVIFLDDGFYRGIVFLLSMGFTFQFWTTVTAQGERRGAPGQSTRSELRKARRAERDRRREAEEEEARRNSPPLPPQRTWCDLHRRPVADCPSLTCYER